LTQNVNTNSSATTLSSSVNPSTLGQSVTFTATVIGTGGTPTGTVTFRDGAAAIGSSGLNAGGQATFTTSALAAGNHSITAVYGGDFTHGSSTSPPVTQTVNLRPTTTVVVSSANPSARGQSVTFTATVAGSGGTPTGTVAFRDGATTLGTATLSGSTASYSTSSLSVGSHSITAVYGGDAQFGPSTSPVLNQAVGAPLDSVRLRTAQIAITKIEAQSSGRATAGAIEAAIGEGLSDAGQLITPSDSGLRINFAAEPRTERVSGAFAAFDEKDELRNPSAPREPSKWLPWIDVRGTGWKTAHTAADIHGGQINALAGLGWKVMPGLLVGAFAGFETFDYRSELLSGRLIGNGWTMGGYLGWSLLPGLRFAAGIGRSSVTYDASAGVAAATIPADRWLVTSALTGTYKINPQWEIEPSARVFALWEKQEPYTDNLGTEQSSLSFATGRASTGIKALYRRQWSETMTMVPYAGIYADYYFTKDDAGPDPLVPEFLQGWSMRLTSGLSLATSAGARYSFGGEVSGVGSSEFLVWSLRGRVAIPFSE
jgi:hypothetical protein